MIQCTNQNQSFCLQPTLAHTVVNSMQEQEVTKRAQYRARVAAQRAALQAAEEETLHTFYLDSDAHSSHLDLGRDPLLDALLSG